MLPWTKPRVVNRSVIAVMQRYRKVSRHPPSRPQCAVCHKDMQRTTQYNPTKNDGFTKCGSQHWICPGCNLWSKQVKGPLDKKSLQVYREIYTEYHGSPVPHVYAVADESDEPDDLDGFNTDDESPAQGSSQTQMHAFDETFYGHPADLHTPDKPSCANTQSRSGSRDRSSLTPSRATPRAAAREVVSTGHVEGTEARSSTPDGTSTRISNASDGWLDFIEPKSRRRRFPDASAFPSAPGSFTSTPASSPVRGQGRRAITDSPSKPHSVAPSAETIAAQSFVDEIRRLGRSAVDSIRLMDESGKAHSEYMAAAAAYKVSKTSANRAAKNTAKMVYDVIKEEYAEAMTAVPGQWTALKQAEDAWACARRGITRAALEQEGAPSDDESVSVPMGTSTSTSRSGSDSGSGAKRKAAFSHAEDSKSATKKPRRELSPSKEARTPASPHQGDAGLIDLTQDDTSRIPAAAKVSALSWPLASRSVFGSSSTSGSKGETTHISTSDPIEALEI